MITVVSGGVGAARLLRGLVGALPPEQVTAVVNVGDDVELYGVHVSPDLDTVTYTVAGAIDPERGLGAGRRELANDGGTRALSGRADMVRPR